ncbi:hypothetical protein CPJCM30710_11710 [Clostridium polyendosporum]|uniref:Tetratricopeptide repeat protein n=1 Tax=Clostridium polyendosporum TaxID=69208 RepID=A0A919RXU6_9CLOT|nr:tetratricopeptide repeat protein [Clostridium polyendosporum]GIM28505.1 hypothetical protein CPJCM30710_11710 [Clostridium polyendosporum]
MSNDLLKKLCNDDVELKSIIESIPKEKIDIILNYSENTTDVLINIGKELLKTSDFLNAYFYFNYIYNKFTPSDFNKKAVIGTCYSYVCIMLNKLDEALKITEEFLVEEKHYTKDLRYKLLFNNILAYKQKGDLDIVLDKIHYVESIFRLNEVHVFNILTLKANILKDKGYLINATKIHEVIFDSSHKIENKLISLCNVFEISIALKDCVNIKKYINKCELMIEEYLKIPYKIYSPSIFYSIGLTYKFLNDFEKAKKYFLHSIELSKEYKNFSIFTKCQNELKNIK